ncbi:hypothetical protein ACFQH6_01155 [Halobacteriaceae archaeon GCM10025711]
MAAGGITYRSHRFITAGLVFLVAWQAGILVGVPRTTEVRLGLFGFVFHVLFAKAYALVPSYFDRDLAADAAMTVQFPLSALGAAALAASPLPAAPSLLEPAGALLWTAGVAVFVGTLAWTVRDNLSGRETATGEAKADREPVDRYANAFVPVALLYLVVASYELLAASLGLPHLFDAFLPRISHLFAAGAATLLLFAVGFRLLPGSSSPRRPTAWSPSSCRRARSARCSSPSASRVARGSGSARWSRPSPSSASRRRTAGCSAPPSAAASGSTPCSPPSSAPRSR